MRQCKCVNNCDLLDIIVDYKVNLKLVDQITDG
jgi:hypothetical protein